MKYETRCIKIKLKPNSIERVRGWSKTQINCISGLETPRDPTWVLFTFERELRNTTPELHDWLMTATTHQAIFPGVIGDGAVQVRLWLQRRRTV